VRWLEEMRENAYSKMTIILIGNKADLAEEYNTIFIIIIRREVSFEEG
jgi:GTPase SAR1 family protein